jgi:urease accessory protein
MMRSDLMLLVDGRLPTGAHAYSAGVEAAVAVGDVVDTASLRRYLDERLAVTGRVEASFAAATCSHLGPMSDTHHDVGSARRDGVMGEIDAEYGARVLSPYLRATSRRLGRQLLRASRAVWPGAAELAATELECAHQPIVLGAAVAAAGGSPHDAAAIALHHLGASVCSAAVRLLGLDPIELATVQAAAGRRAALMHTEVDTWIAVPPARLPATGGVLTEILGEHHGSSDARMFVA